jgi:predicted ferric reductase
MQQPRHARFVARDVGPATISVLVVAQAVLWMLAKPRGEPTGRHIGQLLGVESILLLSIGLVLISTLPWVEEWFDGIDSAAIWHRRVAPSRA